MSNFSIDYSKLEDRIVKDAYLLSEVKDQIERVAFDVVRFKDNDKGADLWQVQSADDGDYIVALYQPDEDKVASSWEVVVTKTAGDLLFLYKGDPIVKIASHKIGIPRNELHRVGEYLPAKLEENKKLVSLLLDELPRSGKNEIFKKYPELA